MALRLQLDQIMTDNVLGQENYAVYAHVYNDATNGIIETIQVSGKDLREVKNKIKTEYKKVVRKAEHVAIMESKVKKTFKEIEQEVFKEIQRETE